MRRLAAAVVPALADYCAVDLQSSPDAARRSAAVHRDPELGALVARLGPRAPGTPGSAAAQEALRTGEPVHLSDLGDADYVAWAEGDEQLLEAALRLRTRALVVAPLRARGRVLGALTLGLAELRPRLRRRGPRARAHPRGPGRPRRRQRPALRGRVEPAPACRRPRRGGHRAGRERAGQRRGGRRPAGACGPGAGPRRLRAHGREVLPRPALPRRRARIAVRRGPHRRGHARRPRRGPVARGVRLAHPARRGRARRRGGLRHATARDRRRDAARGPAGAPARRPPGPARRHVGRACR